MKPPGADEREGPASSTGPGGHGREDEPRIEEWRLARFRQLRPDLAELMVERFGETARRRVREIREALARGDLRTVREAGHSLKGTAATVGARRLSLLAEAAEKRPPGDGAEAEARLAELETELRETLADLSRISGPGPTPGPEPP